MSTRIGKYYFEDTLEDMSIEKLEYLREACDHFIKEKHSEEIHNELTRINLLAHTYGLDIGVLGSDDNIHIMNELTLTIQEHK